MHFGLHNYIDVIVMIENRYMQGSPFKDLLFCASILSTTITYGEFEVIRVKLSSVQGQ